MHEWPLYPQTRLGGTKRKIREGGTLAGSYNFYNEPQRSNLWHLCKEFLLNGNEKLGQREKKGTKIMNQFVIIYQKLPILTIGEDVFLRKY